VLNLVNAGHAGSVATHIAMDGVVYRDMLAEALAEHRVCTVTRGLFVVDVVRKVFVPDWVMIGYAMPRGFF
jgi:hypothetical protein